MKTTVYVAAPWVDGGYAKSVAKKLRASGIRVKSRWLRRASDKNASYDYTKDKTISKKEHRVQALTDVADVTSADVLLVLNTNKSEGKAVEQGIALALRKPVVVVGKPSNVFQYLAHVRVVPHLKEAIKLIKSGLVF